MRVFTTAALVLTARSPHAHYPQRLAGLIAGFPLRAVDIRRGLYGDEQTLATTRVALPGSLAAGKDMVDKKTP